MAKPTVKFMSYNSTGLNSAKVMWVNELAKTCDIQMCSIQEHFKKSQSLTRFFKSAFPKFETSFVPGHREDSRDTGRAQGGLAQLVRKDLKIRKSAVMTSNWRLQGQILHFGEYRLLWMNCYFPTDPKIINFDETELLEVQGEVEKILEAGGYDDCLLGGDFNYDQRRSSGFARSMREFLERLGLVSVWEKHPIDFTHVHTDDKSTSILDNFYMNERLLQYVESAGPLHLGDNLSRHSPIMLCLQIDEISKTREVEDQWRPQRRLAWNIAEEEQLKQYSAGLAESLSRLQRPASLDCKDVNCSDPNHTAERDSFVLDVMSTIIEVSHTAIQKKPISQGSSHVRLPGWNENVEPLKQDAKFWYSIWLSAGRPQTGALHSVMVGTRIKYRCAVRKTQQIANKSKAVSLLEAAERGDKALLSRMKSVMGSKKSPQEMPASLEGEVGEAEILDKFRTLYEQLYNSCSTSRELDGLLLDLKEKINCLAEGEVSKVTSQVVQRACQRMNPGKQDVSSSYTSDVFRHGPSVLHETLAGIFRSFLVHGTVPLPILVCSFMPLLKSRKNPAKFDSYRAVAGASQLLKLFEYCILEVWGDCLKSDGLQFGFKSGTGADQCSWLLLTTAEYFKQRGSNVLCCLLDVSKGFDRVKFSTLFSTLSKKLPAIVVRVLVFTYVQQSGFVRLGGRQSASFSLTNGTRQGAVASPALWAVYVDDLILHLRGQGLGCFVAGVYMGALLYVDDLALLAPTRAMLARMLSVVEEYGRTHNLKFSTDENPSLSKSKCIFFAAKPGSRQSPPPPLKLYGRDLPWVDSALHLGHTLNKSLSMEQDTKIRRARFISRSVEVREQFAFAHPGQVLRAVQIYCSDAYGSPLWRLDSPAVTSYFKAWSSCVRRVYYLPVNTYTYLVEGHLAKDFTPLRNMVLARYPAFYRRLHTSSSKEVKMMAELASGNAQTVTSVNLAHLQHLTMLDPALDSIRDIKLALPVKSVPEKEEWRLGLLDKLLELRGEKRAAGEDLKQVTAMISSLCST